jgi:hypothetical protein
MDQRQIVVRCCFGGVGLIVGGRWVVPMGWSQAMLEWRAAVIVRIKVGGEGTRGAR